MNKFTTAIATMLLAILFTMPVEYAKGQCTYAMNELDSIAILSAAEYIDSDDKPMSEWTWWGVEFADTLGECRVVNLFIDGSFFGLSTINNLNLPFLKELLIYSVYFNSFEDLSFEGLPSLESLIFDTCESTEDPKISDFKIPSLKELNFRYMRGDFGPFQDFSNMPNLRRIAVENDDLFSNFIGTLPNFSNLPNLEEIYIPRSDLTGPLPDFSNLTKLKKLKLAGNFDTNFTVLNIPSLEELYIEGPFDGELPILNLPKVKGSAFIKGYFKSIAEDFTLPSGDTLIISGNGYPIPDFTDLTQIETLELIGSTGTIPNFSNVPYLTSLKLYGTLTGVIPEFDNLPLLTNLNVCNGENDFIGPTPTLENCPLLNINEVDFSCVRPAPLSASCPALESDSLQLVNFYNATNGDDWLVNTGWLTDNLESWWGVEIKDTLNQCRVTKLLVRGIPEGLILPAIDLPFLEELILDYNRFAGTIPDLSNLTNLKILNLEANNFEGSLPNLNNLTLLEEVNLSTNLFTGEISSFQNLSNLKTIDLSNNKITGQIPNFANNQNLQTINLSNNLLAGTIPNPQFTPNLNYFNISSNQLTGVIPNFNNIPALEALFIGNNNLEGRLPNFTNLPFLIELGVCNNNLIGTVPNFSFSPMLNVNTIDFSCLQSAKVMGTVYYDVNNSCEFDDGDVVIPNGLISVNNGANYHPVDDFGHYEIAVEVGTSLITFIQTSPLWNAGCENTQSVTSISINDVNNINFANQPTLDCAQLTVDIGTPFLRRCFKNTYTVQYCNEGTNGAADAYIEMEFDDKIIPLSASIPYDELDNMLVFQLGNVGIGECGSFTVVDSVSCTAPLESTGCVEAHIYPDEFCFLPLSWDGANLAVNAFCLNDEGVQFVIENLGEDMQTPSNYKMYVEQVITVQEDFILQSGEIKTLDYPATGETYRVVVEQTPDHPSQSDAQAYFEFCGDGNFSTGFINSQLLPDADFFLDIDCGEIIGSYDPNDKLVTPSGVGVSKDIYEGDDLTYKIRFQNTGNDTAFTVVLVDTLDIEHLDISTLEVLNSSHSYTLLVEDASILTFTFDDILLVDSTANEAASHGFVTFKIAQNDQNSLGDVIKNKAYIYFDYNEAIITPTVFNTLAEPMVADNFESIPFVVGVENIESNNWFAKVYPNPASEIFYIELPGDMIHLYTNLFVELYNINGQKMITNKLSKPQNFIDISLMKKGVYYYKLFAGNKVTANGKLLIQ